MSDLSHLNVLLVDDSKTLRALLSRTLKEIERNVVISEAADGDEGIESYKKDPADIVFLDINMPGKDGIEVLKILKENDASTYVVMLTANRTYDWVMKAKKYGANGYLGKPFTTEKLAKTVADYSKYRGARTMVY